MNLTEFVKALNAYYTKSKGSAVVRNQLHPVNEGIRIWFPKFSRNRFIQISRFHKLRRLCSFNTKNRPMLTARVGCLYLHVTDEGIGNNIF